MKWLQWSNLDLKSGVGGVENHARCLARELEKHGVDVVLSSNLRDLAAEEWDVIHTHGSNFDVLPWAKSKAASLFSAKSKRPVRVFTHHGLTHERMLACREFFWPGGYRAAVREFVGAKLSDVILSVNEHTHSIVKHLAPVTKVCLNAWDTGPRSDEGPEEKIGPELDEELKKREPYFIFVGRFYDAMKGPERVHPLLEALPRLNFVACPGLGFENEDRVFKTGRQRSSDTVLEIVRRSAGLISTSTWESGPIAVLEALGQGVPVVCPPVGLVPSLSPKLQGLLVASPPTTENFVKLVEKVLNMKSDSQTKTARAEMNRRFLPSWEQAAKTALDAVHEFQSLV